VAGAVVALVVPAVLATAGTRPAASASDNWLPDVQLSARLSGPVIAAGRLLDQDSNPALGRVTLLVWPTNDVLARSAVGDQLKVFPVGKDETDASGNFALKVDPAIPLGEVMTTDGVVNFEIVALGTHGGAAFHFSRQLNAADRSWRAVDPSGLTPGMSRAGEVTDALRLQPGVGLSTDAAVPDAASKFCVTTTVAQYQSRLTKVGEVYTGPSAKAQVVYTTGSVSSLGVGFSLTGAAGSWSQSGTASWTTETVNTFPWRTQNTNQIMHTYYGYMKTNMQCWDRGAYWQDFEFHPYQYEAGQYMASASIPSYSLSNCRYYYAGGGLKRTSGAGYQWSAGVSVSGQIGINLTAKTDYSSKTTTEYTFLSNGNLCGTNAPPGSATRLVARGP
jgi:hypothetical protein